MLRSSFKQLAVAGTLIPDISRTAMDVRDAMLFMREGEVHLMAPTSRRSRLDLCFSTRLARDIEKAMERRPDPAKETSDLRPVAIMSIPSGLIM